MTTFLESHFKDDELQHMKNLWVEETKAKESKSAKRWKSKQIWMENYASNFNNPQLIKSKQQKISRESTDRNRRNHFTNNHKHQYQARQSNRTDDTNNNKHFRRNKRPLNLQQRNTFREKQQEKQRFTNSRRASNPKANKQKYWNTRINQNPISPAFARQPTYAEIVQRAQNTERGNQRYHVNENERQQNHFLNPPFPRNHIPSRRTNMTRTTNRHVRLR